MRRRSIAVAAVVAMLSLLVGLPAIAHSVSYTVGEQGTLECGGPGYEPAETKIYAQAHHRHKVGGTPIDVHYAADGVWRPSSVNWEVIIASFYLYRQSGWGFSTANSYGVCW